MATKDFLNAMKQVQEKGYDNVFGNVEAEKKYIEDSKKLSYFNPPTPLQSINTQNQNQRLTSQISDYNIANTPPKKATGWASLLIDDKGQPNTAFNVLNSIKPIMDNPITNTLAGYGAGAQKGLGISYLNKLISPDYERNMEQIRQENPTASMIGNLTGSILPFAKASKLAGKIPLINNLGTGAKAVIAKTALQEGIAGAGYGAVKGALDEATRDLKPNEERNILGNALKEAGDYGYYGGMFGGLTSGLGQGISKFKTDKALKNIDEAYSMYKNNPLGTIYNKNIATQPTVSKIGTILQDITLGNKLKNVPNKEFPLALPEYRGEVIPMYPKDYPLSKAIEPLALPPVPKRLMLGTGSIELPPSKPIRLGEAPQGRFTIKPEELVVATNEIPKRQRIKNIFDEIPENMPVRNVKTIETPRYISDFTPQQKTLEARNQYNQMMQTIQNSNMPKPNFNIETPYKVYPGEMANANRPLQVPEQFKKEIFSNPMQEKLITKGKRINTRQNNIINVQNNAIESNLRQPIIEGDMNSPLTNKNAIKGNIEANNQFRDGMKLTNGNNIPSELQRTSQVKTNTMQDKLPETQTPEGQKFVKDFEATYEFKPDESMIARANERLVNDYKGTYDNIMQNGVKTKEDNLAGWKIARDLMSNGNWEQANKLIVKIRPDITNAAQLIQSMNAVPKNSLEGVALNARKIIDGAESLFKKENPKKYAEIINKVKNEAKIIDNVVSNNYKLLNVNLQLFAETVDKQLKQAMGKLYKKNYIDNIINLAKSGKYNEETLLNAIKQKYGIPSFSGYDLESITNIYKQIENLPKDSYDFKSGMAKIDLYVKNKIPTNFSEKIKALLRINLLLNQKTMVRNVAGNVVNMATSNIKDFTKIPIDAITSAITKNERTTTLKGFGASLKAQAKGLKKGFNETFKDRQQGISTSPYTSQYEFPQQGNVFKKGILGKLDNATRFGLTLGDRPFYQAAYDGSLANQMKVKGVLEPTEEMVAKAHQYALERTFQDVNSFTEAFRKAQNVFNLGKDFGVGNLILPFTKTPANILKRAVEYSPISVADAIKEAYNATKGTFDQSKFVNSLAKAVTGTAIIKVGYDLAKKGVISASSPSDFDAQSFQSQEGYLPYAFNIGDMSYTFDWAQPTSIGLAIGANLFKDGKSVKQTENVIIDAINSGGNTLFQQPLLQGISKLFTSKDPVSAMSDTIIGAGTQFIPMGSLSKQFNTIIDDNTRSNYDESNIKSKLLNPSLQRIPFGSKLLPKKIGTTGEEVKSANGFNNLLNVLFNPINMAQKNNNPTNTELMRLYNDAGENKQFPPLVKNDISYKTTKKGEPQKKTLDSNEKMEFQKELGQKSMIELQKVMNSYKYKQANDKQKADLLSNAISDTKQKLETKFLKSNGIREYKSRK